jgi:hypothetical protein
MAGDLVDWTGRQVCSQKRGMIPSHLSPILERLGIDTSSWCDLVKKFGKLFRRAVGNADSLANEAGRRGISYLHAPGASMLTTA